MLLRVRDVFYVFISVWILYNLMYVFSLNWVDKIVVLINSFKLIFMFNFRVFYEFGFLMI